MIRVECESCGATFQAKDALAGRRGKCPKCQAGIMVPEVGVREPVPASAPVATRSSTSRRRVASGAARSRLSKHGKSGMGPVVVVFVVTVAIAGLAFVLSGGSEGKLALQQAIEHKTRAEYDEAIKLLLTVPEDSKLYGMAQTELTDVRELQAADITRRLELKAGGLYDNIKSVEKNWVVAPGANATTYAPNTRYMLKRCAEFLDKYPNDSRAKEIGLYAFRYAKVASLDKPPSEADVEAELKFRFVGHGYRLSVLAIEEFAGLPSSNPDAVRRLRDKVQVASLDYWMNLKAQLEARGSLSKGNENWQQVANTCKRYLDAIEGVPGVTPAVNAKILYERALEG